MWSCISRRITACVLQQLALLQPSYFDLRLNVAVLADIRGRIATLCLRHPPLTAAVLRGLVPNTSKWVFPSSFDGLGTWCP